MIAYVDAFVLLRVILRAPESLSEWEKIEFGIASELIALECYRAMDRLRALDIVDADELAAKLAEIDDALSRLDLIPLDRAVLTRAARPTPVVLGSLDAIHLASALLYLEAHPEHEPLAFATHDRALAAAARNFGFSVLGA